MAMFRNETLHNYIFFVTCLVFSFNNGRAALSIDTIRNQTVITLDSQTHLDYGLAYPAHELAIPSNNDNLRAYRKFISEEPWYRIEEKHPMIFLMELKCAI